jgi:mRNA interferase MazF
MKRGEIYHTGERVPERGGKPGYYVVVSRDFVATNDDISTVVCAPVYGEVLGLSTEVVVGPAEGLPRTSAVRCDFLTLMLKRKLTGFVGSLGAARQRLLDDALCVALDVDRDPPRPGRAAG